MCVGVHALIFLDTYFGEEFSLIVFGSDKQAKKSINIFIMRVSCLFETREIPVCSLIAELHRTGSTAKTIQFNYRILKYVFNT